ncbi:MAG: glycosyltransferase family 4 protein [Halobacteriota archaeon]
MKLLICASEYYPYGSGIANVAYNVVEQLKKMGVDCTVCSPTGPEIKLGSSKLIEKSGIVGLVYYWHRVSKYFKKNDFDIVWLHNPLFLESNPFQRSLITICSTYYRAVVRKINPKIYYKIASKIEKNCLNKIKEKARFTGVSTQVCEELKEIGIDRQRIVTILNGVDTERFKTIDDRKIRSELGLENKHIILYVGRLARGKLVDTIIKSMPFILNEINNVKLLIVGDGPQKNEIINIAKKLGIYNSIVLCGAQSNDKLPLFYSMADVVVCPYSGLVLFEAMSMGKAIVAFDVEWHSEVIINMKNGILVENLNINKLSKAIIKLLENKEFSDKLGNNAREYAVNNLNWELITERYLEEFEKVLSNEE